MPRENAAGRAGRHDPSEEHRPAAKRNDAAILVGDRGDVQPLVPLAVDANGVSDLLGGLSVRTVRSMNARGLLPRPLEIGRRRVWSVEELRNWVAAACPSREKWEARRG
jgi:predicted DNA-binding transcriptional regulator AlpA